MEESLKRLKQARKTTAASTTGNNGGPSDDSKIRLQLALDVEYLGEQVRWRPTAFISNSRAQTQSASALLPFVSVPEKSHCGLDLVITIMFYSNNVPAWNVFKTLIDM